MPATIYYDSDADLSLLKDKTIAILGYGSQGHAQAQNLRDSGCNVIIGQRPGSANYDLAVSHGFGCKPVPTLASTGAGFVQNIDRLTQYVFISRDHGHDTCLKVSCTTGTVRHRYADGTVRKVARK